MPIDFVISKSELLGPGEENGLLLAILLREDVVNKGLGRSEVGRIYTEGSYSKTTGDVQLGIFLDDSLGNLLLSSSDDIR